MLARLLLSSAAMLASVTMAFSATADLPMGFLPPAWVGPSVRKTLSPEGRFVLNLKESTVRVVDTGERIAEVARVLSVLQKAPAQISLEIGFVNFGQKTVARPVPPAAPADQTDFPYPHRFSPPKVIQNASGGFAIVPTQPLDFRSRSVGTSATATVETVETTEPTRQIIRRVQASSIPGQPSALPIVSQVADPGALHALALRLGAIPATEPTWAAARTELLLRTELSNAELQVTVTPQIALPAGGGAPSRVIPLTACAAVIPINRLIPAPTGKLPQTDAEFYQLFLGTPLTPDATTALHVTAKVQYLGTAPP